MNRHLASLPAALAFAFAISGLTGCNSSDEQASSTPQDNSQPATTVPAPAAATPPAPAENGRLNVVAAFPSNADERVALVSDITVRFDANLIAGQTLTRALRLTSNGELVAGSVGQPAADTLTFNPENLLAPNAVYQVELAADLMSADGLPLAAAAQQWQFTTIADVYTTPQDVIDLCMSELDVEMLAAVNSARQQSRSCGSDARPAVGKLRWNCLIQEAAIGHSQDMASNDFFSHTGNDGSNIGLRIDRTGYPWSYVGENLAAGQRNVTEVMTGLLDSPGHCRNIMEAGFTEFGFGYAYGEATYYRRYWTQNFATPRR